MVLQGIVLILVLGIAVFQVVQGLFSAIIMMMLTILSAAVAFEYYEALARVLLYDTQPAHAEAASLITLFVLPLLGLRLGFDRLIRNNVVMGMWIDRIGGGLVGLVTGLVLTGVLCTALLLLPFGESIIGYTSHDQALEEDQGLFPVSFTLGMIDGLSKLGLSGQTPFSERHPDFELDAFCARNTGGRNGRLDAAPGALKVLSVYEPHADNIPTIPARVGADGKPTGEGEPLGLPGRQGSRIVIVRLAVSAEARNEDDNWWRLPATHFRLVSDTGRSHYPVAYLTAQEVVTVRRGLNWDKPTVPKAAHWLGHMPPRTDQGKLLLADLVVSHKWHDSIGPENLVIDWVYLVPREQNPEYVAFRRVAVSDVLPKAITKGAWPPVPAKADPVIKSVQTLFRVVKEEK